MTQTFTEVLGARSVFLKSCLQAHFLPLALLFTITLPWGQECGQRPGTLRAQNKWENRSKEHKRPPYSRGEHFTLMRAGFVIANGNAEIWGKEKRRQTERKKNRREFESLFRKWLRFALMGWNGINDNDINAGALFSASIKKKKKTGYWIAALYEKIQILRLWKWS